MKKIYLIPKQNCIDLELEGIIAGSKDELTTPDESLEPGEYDAEVKEQRGGSLWDNEW